MLVTLVTYQKGTQKVHLMENPQTKMLYVMHEDKEGLSQFPCQYDDGRIAYDHPERVNKGIKPLIYKAFDARKMLEFARKYEGYHTLAQNKYDLSIAYALQEAGVLSYWEDTKQFKAV